MARHDGPVPEANERTRLAFWVHQVIEYLVGLLLVLQGLSAARPLGPVLAGVAVLVLAATAHGPVAAAKWVPRRVHRVLDFVLAAGLVVLGLVIPDERIDGFGRFVLVVAGLVLAVLALRTSYATRPAPTPQAGPSRGEDLGRSAGRAVGKGINELRRRSGGDEPSR